MTALFDEPPIAVSPTMARAFGLPAAVFLQQLHYWTEEKARNPSRYTDSHVNGYFWVYNTVAEWLEQLPFLGGDKTFKRMLGALKDQGVLVIEHHNRYGFDKTNWYRINYLRLNQILANLVSSPLGQNVPSRGSKSPNGEGQIDPTNTRDYTETTTETTEESTAPAQAPVVTVRIEKQEPIPRLKSDKPMPKFDPDGFERFYAQYPVHKGRAEACLAWDKLKPPTDLQQTLMHNIALRKQGDKDWIDGFAPWPQKYLNKARWTDEWAPAKPGQPPPGPRRASPSDRMADDLEKIMNG